jgi:hypothetical protein
MAASWGWNIHATPIEVMHEGLRRLDDESPYKSCCPVCAKGVLLLSRRLGSRMLQRVERCTQCGQAFWYMDESVNGEPFEPDQPKRITEELRALIVRQAASVEVH